MTGGWSDRRRSFGSRRNTRGPLDGAIRGKRGKKMHPGQRGCGRSGAVVIGKTTMPEFAWKVTTDSPLFGVTRTLTIVAAAEAVHAIDPRRDHRRGGRHDDQRPLAPQILIGPPVFRQSGR